VKARQRITLVPSISVVLTCLGGSVAPLLGAHAAVSVLLLREKVAIAYQIDEDLWGRSGVRT
jgi:hypothetical protein